MAGSVRAGKQAAQTNKQKYDDEYLEKYGMTFYQYIGSKGGKNGRTGGFYANRELASKAGAIGGARSRRGKNKTDKEKAAKVTVEQEKKSRLQRLVFASKYKG